MNKRAADRLLDELYADGFDLSEFTQAKSVRVRCSQCAALVINGVPAHERGCPNKAAVDRQRRADEREKETW